MNNKLIPTFQASIQDEKGRHWDKKFKEVQRNLNASSDKSTKKGHLSYYLVFLTATMKEVRKFRIDNEKRYTMPSELQEEPRQRILKEKEKHT